MKVVAVVQARMNSTRLPKKAMKLINGKPMIELLLERLSKAKELDQIILATSIHPSNQILVDWIKNLGYPYIQGSENDVLERFLVAGKYCNADLIVRITGDCPLVDSELVDKMIQFFMLNKFDYLSNTKPPTYPDGFDVEIFTFDALEKASKDASEIFDREHVTPYIRESGKFLTGSFENSENLSNIRLTVDEEVDFLAVEKIFNYFYPNVDFGIDETLDFFRKYPELFTNQNLTRNEGSEMSQGQKLWRYAKKIIPGGNMLLSKRSEMFLPEKWPSYFSKSKGCIVWDLDSKQYIDMSIMGIGTNILGYGHPEVDHAVRKVIDSGNMSTLNCPEEVYLIEKLLDMHPWANMGKLARTGGEANAIAIRIARAATGKDKVAVCGYHGWHDWYLSANLSDEKNLSEHLLPGLEPNGVPKGLSGTIFTFNYNDYPALEDLVTKHDIGIIKMEVSRNQGPEDGFLNKVRKLATEKNIVLIFDECTSGFRETFGGLHKKYNVSPDMAIFGKALGNGYAITAIIGTRSVMEAANNTFISSTFWTERIGPAAALKTLEIMEREKSWEVITETGNCIRQHWLDLSRKYDLNISIWGIPALSGFTIQGKDSLGYKTLITQEMLRKGFLAGNSIYTCIDHTKEIIEQYIEILDPIFLSIRKCEDGVDLKNFLKVPVCQSGFKRLN